MDSCYPDMMVTVGKIKASGSKNAEVRDFTDHSAYPEQNLTFPSTHKLFNIL